MKKHFVILFALGIVLAFVSCEDDKANGSIYGRIIDLDTGEPIQNANVQLRPSGITTLTGSDGTYEILDLKEGYYKMIVSKDGYIEWDDDYVEVISGKRTQRDYTIAKIPFLYFLDMQDDLFYELDFGKDKDMLSFQIYNPGTISHKDLKITPSCDWLANVSDPPMLINPGESVTITVQIDRSKLELNRPHWGALYVTSDQWSGIVRFKAYGPNYVERLPVVTTTPPKLNGYDIVTGGNITFDGGSKIKERGILWNLIEFEPIMGASNIIKSDAITNVFTSTINTSTINDVSEGTIYIRAYAINENGIGYGKVYSYKYNKEYVELPTFGFNGHIYKVAPDYPRNYSEGIDYDFAVDYCGFERYGYTDWFMPNIEQLQMMYLQKGNIGGFCDVIENANHEKFYVVYHSCTRTYCTDLPKVYGNKQMDWTNGNIYTDSKLFVLGKYDNATQGEYWRTHVRPIRMHE